LLAGSIVAFEAAFCLAYGLLNGHERDVTFPVVNFSGTIAVRGPVELLRVGLPNLGVS
jgi:hypothetical protein